MQLKLKEFFYIPNLLSISRIFIVIPIFYLIRLNTPEGNWWLLLIALIGSATDILDGYLSRKMNLVTDLGIILDPLADKIGMAVVFIALIMYRNFPIPLLVLLLYRDLMIVLAGTIVLKEEGKPMMANVWGKANTAIFALLALLFMMNVQGIVTTVFIYLAYLSLLASSIAYAIRGLNVLLPSPRNRIFIWVAFFLLTVFVVYNLRHFPFIN